MRSESVALVNFVRKSKWLASLATGDVGRNVGRFVARLIEARLDGEDDSRWEWQELHIKHVDQGRSSCFFVLISKRNGLHEMGYPELDSNSKRRYFNA
jgi:hypothetical protein